MGGIDSRYAWWRLAASVAISTLGGVGMWSIVVALPVVQSDLGVSRAEISFAYTTTMLGFCAGGVVMGRLVDTKGIVPAVMLSALLLALGFAAAGLAPSLGWYAAAQGLLIGVGAARPLRRWSPTSRIGSRSVAAWLSPSLLREIISPAPFGRL